MVWKIEWDPRALKELRKISQPDQRRIVSFMTERVATTENPFSIAKPLSATLKGLVRFRVGEYRIICDVKNEKLVIMVVRVGHRKDVYR